jgi:hypothetical protein
VVELPKPEVDLLVTDLFKRPTLAQTIEKGAATIFYRPSTQPDPVRR